MTEIAATTIPLHLKPGRHNMASAAFEALRAARRENEGAQAESKLTFGDLLDTLNPLHHLPVIGEVYRNLTGDDISPHARMAGATLYGGPIGLVATVASLAISGDEKQGLGDKLFAGIFGSDDEPEVKTASAENPPSPAELSSIPKPVPQIPEATPLKTASLATPIAESHRATSHANMPRLSPEAFDALIHSFADPALMKDEKERHAAFPPSPPSHAPQDNHEITKPATGNDLLGVMQDALMKYEAMQQIARAE